MTQPFARSTAILAIAWGVLTTCRSAAPAADAGASLDPSVLVLCHSYSGRTARVGREIASMLGGRFLRYGDAFDVGDPPTAPPLSAIRPALALGRVRRLFLGFPVWQEQPSGPVRSLVPTLDLRGIEVIPFYTYLHWIDPAALERLAAAVRSRGGAWREPIGLRVPVSETDEEIARRAQRALLDRRDLWAVGAAPPAIAPRCAPAPPPHDATLCRVPAGPVWIGDDASPASPPGYPPPRLRPVGAFEIDRGEVTIAQYKRCEQAHRCPHVAVEGSFCRVLVQGGDTLPIPCASFDDARAYCTWVGMRLPTEAEWMRAGRGETLSAFPWGDDDPTRPGEPLRGNFGETASRGHPHFAVVPASQPWPVDGSPGLSSPCRFPAGTSPFGVCDLAGNLAEWVTGDDPGEALLKGGSWLDAESAPLRLASRGRRSLEGKIPPGGFFLSGFRCLHALGSTGP